MPVFDIAAGTRQLTGPGIMNPAYEGRAMRANIGLAEKELEQADDILELKKRGVDIEEDRETRLAEAQDIAVAEKAREFALSSAAAGVQRMRLGDTPEQATEQLYSRLGQYFGEENLDAFRQSYDPDGDGTISAEEWTALEADVIAGGVLDPETGRRTLTLEESMALPGMTESRARNSVVQEDAEGQIFIDDAPTGLTEEDLSVRGNLPGSAAEDETAARQIREVMGATDNLVSGIERVSELVTKAPQRSMGLIGNVSGFIDNSVNAMIGLADLMAPDGASEFIEGVGEVEVRSLLDTRLYSDHFEAASVFDARIQSNAVGLAYALARAANPDGRISDADVRHQLDRLNLSQSSKARIQAALEEVKISTLTGAMNWLRTSGATAKPEGSAAYAEYERQLAEIYSGEERPIVRSQEDYDALPSGAEFIDENGQPFRKP